MKWITREHAKVDRVACPWLFKKFVDQDAEFVFAPPDKVMDEAKRLGAIPYDVKNVEFDHHDHPWALGSDVGSMPPALRRATGCTSATLEAFARAVNKSTIGSMFQLMQHNSCVRLRNGLSSMNGPGPIVPSAIGRYQATVAR